MVGKGSDIFQVEYEKGIQELERELHGLSKVWTCFQHLKQHFKEHTAISISFKQMLPFFKIYQLTIRSKIWLKIFWKVYNISLLPPYKLQGYLGLYGKIYGRKGKCLFLCSIQLCTKTVQSLDRKDGNKMTYLAILAIPTFPAVIP